MRYQEQDLQRIAAAVGLSADRVEPYLKHFEAAAFLCESRGTAFPGRTPLALKSQLERIAANARRLLESLGVDQVGDAADGPADPDILRVLTYPPGSNEGVAVEASGPIGRLVEILQAIDAAQVIARVAREALPDVDNLARLTSTPGNVGNPELDNWVGDMMRLYRLITGKEPGISVGAVGLRNEGEAMGPLIRFFQAAGTPRGLNYSEDAWGSRIKSAQARARERESDSI